MLGQRRTFHVAQYWPIAYKPIFSAEIIFSQNVAVGPTSRPT